MAVCLLYLWLAAFDSQVIKWGLRKLVERTSRRDRSSFCIGFDSLLRCITYASSLTTFLALSVNREGVGWLVVHSTSIVG